MSHLRGAVSFTIVGRNDFDDEAGSRPFICHDEATAILVFVLQVEGEEDIGTMVVQVGNLPFDDQIGEDADSGIAGIAAAEDVFGSAETSS